MSEPVAGWLGFASAFFGLIAAFLFARAASRGNREQNAINALNLLPKSVMGPDANAERKKEPSGVLNELYKRILSNTLLNRNNMWWGSALLFLSFFFLLAQSVALIWP